MSGVYNAMDTHTHISDFRLSLFHPIPCIVDNAILGSLCIQYSIFFGHGMGSCIEWMHSERVKEKKKCTLDDNSKPPAQGNKMMSSHASVVFLTRFLATVFSLRHPSKQVPAYFDALT